MAVRKKTTIEDEIERAQKRLEELKKRKLNQKKTAALQFFTKNNIEMLLDSPEKLQEFTKEIKPVIEKFTNEKSVAKDEETAGEEVQDE